MMIFQPALFLGLLAVAAMAQPPPKFELGRCMSNGGLSSGGPPLNWKAEEEARKSQKWDAIIESDKWNVRADCSVPYRWEQLLRDLASAGRFADAASLADQLKQFKITLPLATIAKMDEKFLSSKEFLASDFGKRFHLARAAEQEAFEQATKKLAAMPAKERPPSPFRRTGACPFECCQFGTWKARMAVKVYDSIGSKKVVAELKKGDQVEALTGVDILEPVAYAITETHGELKAGGVLFFLDYLGEGAINFWYAGRENPELKGVDTETLTQVVSENCESNSGQECWLRKLAPGTKEKDEWWVKVKMKSGKTGWALGLEQFEGNDSCG